MKTRERHRSVNERSSRACDAAIVRRTDLSLCRRLFVVAACAMILSPLPAGAASARPGTETDTSVRFAVLSDLHYYDVKLGTSGTAFDNYMAGDRKLLPLSEPITDAVLADLLTQGVSFVIVSGDLTKDGEVLNHTRVAQYLQKLRQAGIGVYVIPGNHDINNADAVSYSDTGTKPVPSASPEVFRALYQRFGYGQAIDHAPDSLSYVAEPAAGLWLLALDSVKWAESASSDHPVISGRLSAATLAWALEKIQQGKTAGKKVIATMHHGVNLHFGAEPVIAADYLLDNWPSVGAQLAAAGLKVIFTGHYHSQDASICSVGASGVYPTSLCDIETGSLLSYPCAYRIAELDSAGMLHVTSRRVTDIAADLGGVSFQTYAENFARAMLPYEIVATLQQMFGVTQAEAQAIAPWVVDAMVANYAGDENPSAATQTLLLWLIGQSEPMHTLGLLLSTLWYDLPPGDNTLTVPVSN